MSQWQNACWVIEAKENDLENLRHHLGNLVKKYRQDSIAFTVGVTEFLTPPLSEENN